MQRDLAAHGAAPESTLPGSRSGDVSEASGAARPPEVSGLAGPPAVSGLAGPPTAEGHFRPDIEGMRAIAIVAVLLYHMGIPGAPGGFVGVDVFYVISGFLITGLLRRELLATGRVSLANFYARRARRLLPAALVVIVATVAASALLLSRLRFPDVALDGAAAALYVSNFRFLLNATDYLAQTGTPSPFLHFWSLAVEEQFYLAWPLLMTLGVSLLSVRRIGWLVLTVGIASLALSIVLTDLAEPWAFFSLPTRAWELAVGAAVAVGLLRLPARAGTRAAAAFGWAGLLLILGSVVLIDADTPFPGVAALAPVCGAALLIVAGERPGAAPSRWLGMAVPRFFGRISYSLYLWHWPILILVPIALGRDDLPVLIGLGVLSVLVAAASTRFVETPFRVRHGHLRLPRRSVALAGVASLVVAVGAAAAGGALPLRPSGPSGIAGVPPSGAPSPSHVPDVTAEPVATASATTGPVTPATPGQTPAGGSGGPPSSAPTPTPDPTPTPGATLPPLPPLIESGPLPADLQPALEDARDDVPRSYADGCQLDFAGTEPLPCVYGNPSSTTTVMLIGDSHAAQWLPALERLAQQSDWRLVAVTKSACPAINVTVWLNNFSRPYRECDTWRHRVLVRVQAEHPALVFIASAGDHDVVDGSGRHPVAEVPDAWRAGLVDVYRALRQRATSVVVLADLPTHTEDPLECLAARGTIEACPMARDEMVNPAYRELEAAAAAEAGLPVIDATDWLCPDATCPPVMGNYLVYRDEHHMTATFSALLADRLRWAIDRLSGT